MKKLAIASAVLSIVVTSASAQVYVKPHFTKDGTFVQGYERTRPNSTDLDNYSTKGNTNPYTGQAGTRTPSYEQPTYQAPRPNTFGTDCGYTSTGRYVCR